jgi:hypothetical protein
VIFAELLHAENFTPSRRDATNFLTRINANYFQPRMDTD